jgi:CBS-domain-containing membrane protein
MNAADVMVSNVITVGPEARVSDVAETLLQNRISAVPVVDAAGKLIGIVSEGDLLHRAESDTEVHRSWWLNALTSNESMAAEFVRSHSQKVTDVMTKRVVTAAPDTPLHEIANLLERHRIKRVPIVKDGKLLGIVSRANLLQALASLKQRVPTGKTDSDAAIRERILAEMRRQSWVRPALINVIVQNGTVELWGVVDSKSEKDAIRVLAETASGVTDVNDNLIVQPVVPGV